MEIQPENNVNHYIFRVGDEECFVNSRNKHIWAIRSSYKTFLKNVKIRDVLWFVRNKQIEDIHSRKVIAVANFVSSNDRIIGELISTLTNEELGWDDAGKYCGTEIHYNNLIDLTNCKLFTGQKWRTVVVNYDNIKEKLLVNLRTDYEYICKYSNSKRLF